MKREEENYIFSQTADGSPTAAWGPRGEKMHHDKGALSETLEIYGRALQFAYERRWPLRVVSVGLGLGYVEMMAAASLESKAAKPEIMVSFEAHDFLRDQWAFWLQGGSGGDAHCQRTFDEISERFNMFDLGGRSLKSILKTWMIEGRWQIQGALTPYTLAPGPFSVILYDAFSRKTSPDLWDENFLGPFLDKFADTPCVFSTYASGGTLKKILKGAHFELARVRGFGGKRESTFAFR